MFQIRRIHRNHFKLKKEVKNRLLHQINRMKGQLSSIRSEIELDQACDETLTQVLAVRGGINKLATDLVSFGILDCLQERKKPELTTAITRLLRTL